jgi:hypothetical protein
MNLAMAGPNETEDEMNQISSTISKPAVPAIGGDKMRFLPVALAGLMILATAIVLTQAIRLPSATSRADGAVDGWEAGILAPAIAVTFEDVQDGYLPGFLASRAPADAVDGYLPGFVAAHQVGDAVDGYLPGFVAAHQVGDAMDGWEAGIGLRQPPRSLVQDGWEAGYR